MEAIPIAALPPQALIDAAEKIYDRDPQELMNMIREGRGYSWTIYRQVVDT